jgi:hypothetical protein
MTALSFAGLSHVMVGEMGDRMAIDKLIPFTIFTKTKSRGKKLQRFTGL